MIKKRKLINKLLLPDDCWYQIILFVGKIEDFNSLQLTCKTFYELVGMRYNVHFGKKLYTNVKEFMESSKFYTNCDTSIDEHDERIKWIQYLEYDYHKTNDKLELHKDPLTLFREYKEYGDEKKLRAYYQQRKVYKKGKKYYYKHWEVILPGEQYWHIGEFDEEKKYEIVEEDFKIFVKKIRGYSFI